MVRDGLIRLSTYQHPPPAALSFGFGLNPWRRLNWSEVINFNKGIG
jgi:hypothetical protein